MHFVKKSMPTSKHFEPTAALPDAMTNVVEREMRRTVGGRASARTDVRERARQRPDVNV
jgi:hypothetical protein